MKKKIKKIYEFKPYISIFKEDINHKLFKRKNFHKIILQNASMVILENKEKKILFLKEYRRGIKKKSLGFPGGHIDNEENPLEAVKRELLEETGLKAHSWKLLFNYVRSGTYYCGKDYVFFAKINKKKTKTKSKEKIEKIWLNKREILKKFKNKEFETAGIMASVLYYLLLISK